MGTPPRGHAPASGSAQKARVLGFVALGVVVVAGVIGLIFLLLHLVVPANGDAPEPVSTTTSEPSAAQDDEDAATNAVTDESVPDGRPTTTEVADGLSYVLGKTDERGSFSDEELTCYAQYFVDSEMSDAALWEIASDEILVSASTGDFYEVLGDAMMACL